MYAKKDNNKILPSSLQSLVSLQISQTHRDARMIFVSYLTDFSYFPLEKIVESCWKQLEQVKNGPFERGCRCF